GHCPRTAVVCRRPQLRPAALPDRTQQRSNVPAVNAPPSPSPTPAEIVSALALPDKVRLLSGADLFRLHGLPEHGLEPIGIADGPHGLRQQAKGGDHLGLKGSVPSTCF